MSVIAEKLDQIDLNLISDEEEKEEDDLPMYSAHDGLIDQNLPLQQEV